MNKYSKMTDDQLKKLANEVQEELSKRHNKIEFERARTLNINGITAKDIQVVYHDIHGDGNLNYSFYVKHDGRSYDFYYDHSKWDKSHKRTFHPWWPVKTHDEYGNTYTENDDWEMNGAREFIPPGFAESMENSYEYDGTVEEVIKYLKNYGITDVQEYKERTDDGRWSEGEGAPI